MEPINTWTAVEAAYFQAMKRSDWMPDHEHLTEMWSHVTAEDLLTISRYLTARAHRIAASEAEVVFYASV